MIVDKKEQLYARLEKKSLDQKFRQRIEVGMNCSPFTSEAISRVVKEVYFPIFDEVLQPGQLRIQCLSIKNKIKAKISESNQISIVLTIDDGESDYKVRKQYGISGLRRHRLKRICNEAFEQGGVLTVEDIAYRIFNVGERTICRDLAVFKKEGIILPLRSVIHDMGPAISHKAVIIKNWLKGDELSDLKWKYKHSYSAIENYLDVFKRIVFLKKDGYDTPRIAFTLKISQKLVLSHLDIWSRHKDITVPHRLKEMTAFIGKKKSKKQVQKNRKAS